MWEEGRVDWLLPCGSGNNHGAAAFMTFCRRLYYSVLSAFERSFPAAVEPPCSWNAVQRRVKKPLTKLECGCGADYSEIRCGAPISQRCNNNNNMKCFDWFQRNQNTNRPSWCHHCFVRMLWCKSSWFIILYLYNKPRQSVKLSLFIFDRLFL